MKRLGELLLERGAIAVGELHTALEACQRKGGRLGTHLLRFGFVEERALLEALSTQHGIPFAPESLLLKVDPEVLRAMPVDMSRRLQAVPFQRMRGCLQVAMANPLDPAALEEISGCTDLKVEVFVATETAVLRALDERIEEEPYELESKPGPTAIAGLPVEDQWEQMWIPPRVAHEQLLQCSWQQPQELAPGTLFATFPGLTPLADMGQRQGDLELDEESFRLRLLEARQRHDIGEALLGVVTRLLSRVCLFAVHRDRVVGWMGRGHGVVVDDLQSLTIPLIASSVLRDLKHSGQHYLGSLPPDEASRLLSRALGEPPPTQVVLAPIRVKEHTLAFLLGDNPGELADIPIKDLLKTTEKAGVAFEMLIMRNKILN